MEESDNDEEEQIDIYTLKKLHPLFNKISFLSAKELISQSEIHLFKENEILQLSENDLNTKLIIILFGKVKLEFD